MNNRGLLDLIISLLPRLSQKEKLLLLKSFIHEEELFLQTKGYIEEVLNRRIENFWDFLEFRNKADRIDTICRMRSIKWVSWTDEKYPPLLREIYDPPVILYYRGSLPDPVKPLLGMVGTRKPSPQAASQAYNIAFGAGKAGISVISGLALGIDAMSHRGNIAAGAKGYAVLGSGVDEIYPSSNRPLAKQILNSKGAVISEYPPGTRPFKGHFPARNRIISGLSRSVIIAEAPEKSGAIITAQFALEQGRDLYVASSGVEDGNHLFDKRGTRKLCEDGSEIIYSYKDILRNWNMDENTGSSNCTVTEAESRNFALSMANWLDIEI